MATFDPTTTEAGVYRALEGHLRSMSVPEDQWLEVRLFARLDSGGGIMAALLEVQDTGYFSMALRDNRVNTMTSLTDTGVQTGQLGPQPEPYRIPEHMRWPSASVGPRWGDSTESTTIQGGEIREPVRSTALETAVLRDQLRQVGEELASVRLQRDEASALAIRSLELLRMAPTSSMSEDIQIMHHALVADPRTRETEALLGGFLSGTVERRAAEIVRDRLAEAEDNQRVVLDGVEKRAGALGAEVVELRSRLAYQRARGWCEMGMIMVLGIALIGWMA